MDCVDLFAKQTPGFDVVDVEALACGMYVSELDRPWLGTPFLMQGFLLEDVRQIDILQQCCKKVLVDRRRSAGDQYRSMTRPPESPRQASNQGASLKFYAGPVPADVGSDESEFLSVARRLREQKNSSPVARNMPPARGSSLEDELIYSSPIIDDVHRTLDTIRDVRDPSGGVDLKRVHGLVEEMASGVERNPDAMLWLTRLKITDQYSYDHAVDVSVHLMVFGRFLGLGNTPIEDLGLAGLMQDIGKAAIDPELLQKKSALSEEEYAQVQSHVGSSLELLGGKHAFSPNVLNIIAAHHERFDGSGYPLGIDGSSLSLYAELAGLVDSYCAMTRHRVFRPAESSQKALETLSRLRGTKFRESLVDQFVQCIGLYPIGTLVELNSGEVAVVIQQNQVRRLRPRVLILLAPDKTLERRPRSLDLMLEPASPNGEPYRIRHALPSNAYGIDPGEFYLD